MDTINIVIMKKSKIFIIVGALALFILNSCCKEYSCTCYNSSNQIDDIKTAKTKKERAEEWCSVLDKQQNKAVEGRCDLKKAQ